MADKKISALTSASTPLAGTEVLPIVQGGATVKVAVSDLTAGRAISATQLTLTTGNVIVANGQGIDFSATPGTGTSELFSDYEEGTFTATLTGSTTAPTTPVTVTGAYTKIGRSVTVTLAFNNVDTTGASGDLRVTGLPFTVGGYDSQGTVGQNSLAADVLMCTAAAGLTYLAIRSATTTIYTPVLAGTGKYLLAQCTYFV